MGFRSIGEESAPNRVILGRQYIRDYRDQIYVKILKQVNRQKIDQINVEVWNKVYYFIWDQVWVPIETQVVIKKEK